MAFTTITNNIVWQTIAFLNELVGAQREREAAVTGSALTPLVVADDDIQGITGIIGDLQSLSLGLLTVGSSDGFFENATTGPANYDGDAAEPSVMTEGELLIAAGVADGFRRLPGDLGDIADWTDYDDPGFAHGAIQADDIIGPWLFVDLQNIYKALTRTPDKALHQIVGVSDWQGTEFNNAVWQDARDAADADWDATGDLGGFDGAVDHWTRGDNALGTFDAFSSQLRGKMTSDADPSGVERTVTFYIIPRAPSLTTTGRGTFDAQGNKKSDGTTDLVDAVLNLVLSETYTGAGGADRESTDQIGSVAADTKPTWVGQPGVDTETALGWEATEGEAFTAVQWNLEFGPSPIF